MKRKYPDGPRLSLPGMFLTQMLPRRFPSDPLAFTLGTARDFGDIAHYNFGPLHVYQLNHPALVRQVLIEEPEKFYKPRVVKRALRPIVGQGLLLSDGALWKQQRKLTQPAFHHRQLAVYADVMVAHAQKLIDGYASGETRDISADMAALTLGIVVKTLLGEELPCDAAEIACPLIALAEAANHRMNSILRIPSWIPTRRNLRERRAIADLDALIQVLIGARRASQESRNDLFSILLTAAFGESGFRISSRQLRDEMMTFVMAGHETTTNALVWTWTLLSSHPEVEAGLTDELDRALAGRAPSASDLPALPFTEMIIREAMRLYPPAPGFAREPIVDVTIGGYQVSKGSLIMISTYALHRDERFFPDPERFDPSRFSPGWEDRIPRCAYLPFGNGPRVCIGNGFALMEARLILATMAQRYRLSLASSEFRAVQLVTLRPSGPVLMKVERRRSAA